jgi:hypothetical protein
LIRKHASKYKFTDSQPVFNILVCIWCWRNHSAAFADFLHQMHVCTFLACAVHLSCRYHGPMSFTLVPTRKYKSSRITRIFFLSYGSVTFRHPKSYHNAADKNKNKEKYVPLRQRNFQYELGWMKFKPMYLKTETLSNQCFAFPASLWP